MRKIKIDVKKTEYTLIVLFLFLAAMNFYAKFFYFVFAAFIVLILLEKNLKVNLNTVPYLLLGINMAIYNADEGILSALRCLAYVFCYMIGCNLLMNAPRDDSLNNAESLRIIQKRGYTVLSAICWGAFIHYMLNFLINYNSLLGRNTNDIWTGERLSATIQAAIACLMTGFAVSMVICPTKKIFRFIGIVSVIGIMAYNLMLAGRTLLFMLVIVFAVGFIYFLANTKNQAQKSEALIIVIVISVVALLLFILNVGGIQDYVFGSNLFLRFDGIDENLFGGERIRRKILFLQNALKYPLGGLHLRERFGYAHDLLLDAYDEYGFIELIILIFILSLGIKNLVQICKNKDLDVSFRLSYLCVYVSILLEFCIEPIFEGVPWLFVCYCLINGCVDGTNKAYLKHCIWR